VAKFIWQNAVRQFLKGKTVILITQQLQFAAHADKIVLLELGHITAVGQAEDIHRRGSPFAVAFQNSPKVKLRGLKNAGPTESQSTHADHRVWNEAVEIQPEDRAYGSVPLRTFYDYLSRGSRLGGWTVLLVILLVAIPLVTSVVSDWILLQWVKGVIAEDSAAIIFSVLVAMIIVFSLTRSLVNYYITMHSSQAIFTNMLHSVLHAPMTFFLVNPQGRVFNRFSKDQALADEFLPPTFLDFLHGLFTVLSSLAFVCYITPWVVLSIIPLGIGEAHPLSVFTALIA